MNSNGSRLKYLAFLALLGILVGLWLAARDGDLLSAVVLGVLAAILLIALGLTAALLIFFAVSRINRPATDSIRDMADAQRSMAAAMATQGRSLNQMPGGGTLPMLPGAANVYPGAGLTLPALTGFHATIEGEADDQEIN